MPHSQMRSGSVELNSSRIAIVDGPATIGIASGTINGSSFSVATSPPVGD